MNFEKYHNFNLRVNACGCQVHICLISSHHSDTENRLQLHNLSDLNNIIIQIVNRQKSYQPPETMQQQSQKAYAFSHVSWSWWTRLSDRTFPEQIAEA